MLRSTLSSSNSSNRSRAFMLALAAACASFPLAHARGQTCEEFTWTRAQTATIPPPAFAEQLIYDPVRQLTMVTMPSPGGPQTWEWNGTDWLLRATGTGPGGDGYSGVYDSLHGVILAYARNGGTWSWDGNQWTQLATTGPGERFMPGMAFDSDRGITVLFDGAFSRDTWEWDGTAWTLVNQLDPHNPFSYGPQSRNACSMWYDPIRHRSVMCCGNGAGYERFYDTWFWDGTEWVQAAGMPYTAGRLGAATTYDSSRGVAVLFGGATGHLQNYWFNDTWEYGADGVWRQVSTQGPGPTPYAGLAFDAARQQCVLFGGQNIGQTWIWQGQPIHSGPTITTQPAGQEVALGATVTFTVVAGGEGTITYQWRRNQAALSDSGNVSGSHAATLTILAVTRDDVGVYDVVVNNPCASVVSDSARLDVPACVADFNSNGVLDSQDFFDFLTAFFASSPSADIDGSGVTDSTDFFVFVGLFFEGCGG